MLSNKELTMQVYSIDIYHNGTLMNSWNTDPMDEQQADEYMATLVKKHAGSDVHMAELEEDDDDGTRTDGNMWQYASTVTIYND